VERRREPPEHQKQGIKNEVWCKTDCRGTRVRATLLASKRKKSSVRFELRARRKKKKGPRYGGGQAMREGYIFSL